ncbi:MAG: class I SAM-dependent rRNA methyltransferase [Legionella longbeachae]|nr:class I SAM-dependent rRNA methyltransferase [Legionella longbeachae]
MNAKVILLAAKQNTVLRGHPWIFPKAIAKTAGKLITGHLVDIFNADEKYIGVGVYNEHSLYRVRVLALVSESFNITQLDSLIAHRLRQAKQVRECINLPNAETTAYRLFNSEADGLSGVTIDRFNQTCVVASSAYWVELNKELIMRVLQELFPSDEIIWMPQSKPLAQDGWKQINVQETHHSAQVLEAGVVYDVAFAQTQKTGLFLDQRENHQRIAQLSKGRKILDLYCYTGGFALHAAKAGALKVTAIDSSGPAIAQGKKNAALNDLSQIEFIEADARDYLIKAGEYDVVVLDPPKLVPSQQHVQRAKNYYRFLHREVLSMNASVSIL